MALTPICRTPAATLSYAGLLDTVIDVERRLDAAGLPPGARIVVRLGEPVEYATALVAIVAAGRVAVPLDPGAPDRDVARVLGVARPAAVVYRMDSCRVNRVGPTGGDRVGLTGEATGPFEIAEFDFDVIDSVDPVGLVSAAPATAGGGIFLCTSGTTGTPKGILLRKNSWRMWRRAWLTATGSPPPTAATARCPSFTSTPRWWACSPPSGPGRTSRSTASSAGAASGS